MIFITFGDNAPSAHARYAEFKALFDLLRGGNRTTVIACLLSVDHFNALAIFPADQICLLYTCTATGAGQPATFDADFPNAIYRSALSTTTPIF